MCVRACHERVAVYVRPCVSVRPCPGTGAGAGTGRGRDPRDTICELDAALPTLGHCRENRAARSDFGAEDVDSRARMPAGGNLR